MAHNTLTSSLDASSQDACSGPKLKLNKHSREFKPSVPFVVDPSSLTGSSEYVSTAGSVFDGIFDYPSASSVDYDSVFALKGHELGAADSVSSTPMPSTTHETPQPWSVPPGYESVIHSGEMYDSASCYETSPTWGSYPAPFHLGYKLFVGALPYSVSEADLFPLFSQFGEILELHVQRDWLGRSKGCAWLRYSTTEECDASIEALHNNYFLGSMNRPMQLTYANDAPPPAEGPRRGARPRTESCSQIQPPCVVPAEAAQRPRALTEQSFSQQPSVGSSSSVLSQLRMMMVDQPASGRPAEPAGQLPCDQPQAPEGSKSFQLSGVPPHYSDKQTENLLSQFGPLVSFRRTHPHRANVEYQHARDAERAKSVIEGVTLAGCDTALTVNHTK